MRKKNKLESAIDESVGWKNDFRKSTLRTNFTLHLSKSMLEFLCAVADDVDWDRSLFPGMGVPDCTISTEACLTKRGLVRRKERDIIEANWRNRKTLHEFSFCELTPAGAALVELLKVTGMFVESDSSIRKKARTA